MNYKLVPSHKRTVFVLSYQLLDLGRISNFLNFIFGDFGFCGCVFSWLPLHVAKKTVVFPELCFVLDGCRLFVYFIKNGKFYTFDSCENVDRYGKICMPIGVNHSMDEIIGNFFNSVWTEFPFSNKFLIPYKSVYKPKLRKIKIEDYIYVPLTW